MEDFLKFLLIAGVVLVGIFKEVSKNKAKKAESKRPVPPMPHQRDLAPDAMPMPEIWRGKMLDELLQPIPIEGADDSDYPKKNEPKKKKKEISIEASLANSAAQDKRNSKEGSHYDTPSSTNTNESEEYTIHSAEEARRAIVWGEILQRKY